MPIGESLAGGDDDETHQGLAQLFAKSPPPPLPCAFFKPTVPLPCCGQEGSVDRSTAEIYRVIMAKVVERGDDFVKTEYKRVKVGCWCVAGGGVLKAIRPILHA